MREEELKLHIANIWFRAFDCTAILGNVDFCVRPKNKKTAFSLSSDDDVPSFLWAEAKAEKTDIADMIVQLILTIGKARTFTKHLPPKFLGAFDTVQIAFIPYADIQDVFYQNDFNWLVTPSDRTTKEFLLLKENVQSTIEKKSLRFRYDFEGKELEKFIKENFVISGDTAVIATEVSENPVISTERKRVEKSSKKDFSRDGSLDANRLLEMTQNGDAQRPQNDDIFRIQIDKNNFLTIYSKWHEKVQPSIAADWEAFKKNGIIDADFYLADLLSENNLSIKDKLNVLLQSNHYKLNYGIQMGQMLFMEIPFKDNQKSHNEFWAKYARPPRSEYWDYIIERRDLLVPQDVRERKGSFFTPQKWVELSQSSIAKNLGDSWQDEYYVWDCSAGTGNLLSGLTNKYNIFASTLDKADVDVMRDRIEHGANLLPAHVFQFDFLNDDLQSEKVPESLRKILSDEEKRKKLIIYINPPYAEVSSKKVSSDGTKGKVGVNQTKMHDKYEMQLGTAGRELFAQFLMRCYDEINGCIIANFSTLKILQGKAFQTMREFFTPKLQSLFLMPAWTFDNVQGSFPIGFHFWDTTKKEKFKEITADVFDENAKQKDQKVISLDNNYINKWISSFKEKIKGKEIDTDAIGYMDGINGNDFQHNNIVYITNEKEQLPNPRGIWLRPKNLIPCCIYFTVRHIIPHTWLNHNDQFLFPNDGWKADKEFQNDCLVFTLFHNKNRVSCKQGVNSWIPFTEAEVDAKEKFSSHFMSDFLAGKIKAKEEVDLFSSAASDAVIARNEASKIPVMVRLRSPQVSTERKRVEKSSKSGKVDCQDEFASKLTADKSARNDDEKDFSRDGSLDANRLLEMTELVFSPEAVATLCAGRSLFRYYHEQDKIMADASLYDTKEFFQGRDENGRMKNSSEDEKYNQLLGALKTALNALAKKIEPKVYEYGFLK